MELGRIQGAPAPGLRGWISSYYGFGESSPTPLRRREGPGRDVVLIVSFGEEWLINGERLTSFAAGLHDREVATEHGGRSFGMHINVAPPAAHMLFALPLHTLARRQVPLDDVLDEPFLVERLYEATDWDARFGLLDGVFTRRLAAARPTSPGVFWAWRRLVETNGQVAVGALAEELGWSRKRIVARFREEVGLPPKAVARLLRFDRARTLAELPERPDWARIALDCGYYDQSHLINDFRAVTGRTPETFFQDRVASPA
jgi:AraC-like DNA-binding protein